MKEWIAISAGYLLRLGPAVNIAVTHQMTSGGRWVISLKLLNPPGKDASLLRRSNIKGDPGSSDKCVSQCAMIFPALAAHGCR